MDASQMKITKRDFGERLHRLLRVRGLSRLKLSDLTGFPMATIDSFVRGDAFPTPAALRKLAIALSVSEGTLLPSGAAPANDTGPVRLEPALDHPGKLRLIIDCSALSLDAAADVLKRIMEDVQAHPIKDRQDA